MSEVTLENVTVEFPVFDARRKMLMTSLIKRYVVGGIIKRDQDHKTPSVTALENINFSLREGDKLAITGHNGAGKTTLLRTILGSYKPVSGKLITRGSIISMVGISLGFDPDASGYENIFIRGAIMGFDRTRLRPYLDEICDFSELGSYIHLPVRTYSSGMSMRLAFSIATTVPADIVLLDEWLSVGDASFSQKAHDRLEKFIAKAKILVLATHNKELADRVCNHFIEMEAGKIISRS